ncbi:endolytic transglycosylase MltG [soil metagenome]
MKKLLLLIFLFILLAVIGGAWFFTGLMPVNNSTDTKRFLISQGESANQIGQELQKENIVKNALAFRIYSQITQAARNIKPGSYELTSNQSVPQIIVKILAGPTEVWVTVPEGLRREEIAQKYVDGFELTDKEADNFYNQFLSLTTNKEGYLFPDTYLFAKDTKPAAVVKIMEDTFDAKYAEAIKTKTTSLTKAEIVNLASIIQREAITPEDMQGVSSALTNRYNIGMPLGSDVTLEYVLGYQKDEQTWWKKDLTADDLLVNSLYNTRLNAGFPPTPISNPGLTAIEAAMNPPQTDYLYYLSDKDGKLHFAQTLEGHNANIEKYLN